MSSAEAIGNDTLRSQNIFGRPLTIFGVPVDREKIFTNHKGVYKSRVEKRQRKLIVKSTFIKFFLHHDETIQCLTTGYSPVSVKEQMITGLAFLYFRRALFVFTEKRILHIPTRFNRSPRSAISQILFEDCARIEIKGRAMHVRYKNGRQEVFPYLGRREKKKLRTLISRLSLSPKEAGRLKGRVHLCPGCTNILPTGSQSCSKCHLAFKSTFKAGLYSLLPGGGYFYGRYPMIGVFATLFETAMIAVLVTKGLEMHAGVPVAMNTMIVPGLALLLAKFIMVFHNRRLLEDFVPEKRDFAMRKI